MHFLEIKDVKKEYSYRSYFWTKKKSIAAVKNVSLSIDEGVCLGLVGESGCGKTTLGRVITGLETPSSGDILLQGKSVVKSTKKQRLLLRRDMQMVFQDCCGSVNPKHTAGRIIIEPARNFLKLDKSKEEEIVDKLMQKVGLNKADKNKYPEQFSGGQLQRICIARALSVNPKIIILDEPLSSLDVSVQAQILNLLSDLKKEYNLSYLLISHDIEAVYYISDAIAVMYLGSIVEYIEDISLFNALCHPYTKKLLSSVLSSDPGKRKTMLVKQDEIDINNLSVKGCSYASRCEKTKDICHHTVPELKQVSEKHYVACHNYNKI